MKEQASGWGVYSHTEGPCIGAVGWRTSRRGRAWSKYEGDYRQGQKEGALGATRG